MQNKILIAIVILLSGYYQIALAAEINVTDASYVWNMTLENATEVNHLIGEPDVMVVKYADVISYQPLENATEVNHLVGEPGVMVVKYADVISYQPLENATQVNHLVGEPGVMVVKYADVISYQPLENATEVNHLVGEPGVMIVKYADVISYQPLDNPTNVEKRELDINISNPQHGDIVLSSPVNVNGTAFSPNEIVDVTVNGVHATGTTSWNASVPLNFGINTIKVNVTTNTTYSAEKSIKVYYYYGGLFGDFNGNGVLDSGDVTILMRKIVGLE
ncbi:MAG: hypothetical protein OIN87_04220 [Candidatus Methanoperedens sp.]|nr:hypothetical protein [Candidatus Methanoperedens sp.]